MMKTTKRMISDDDKHMSSLGASFRLILLKKEEKVTIVPLKKFNTLKQKENSA